MASTALLAAHIGGRCATRQKCRRSLRCSPFKPANSALLVVHNGDRRATRRLAAHFWHRLQLHHTANRCRDAEETRAFYEDFMGLPLAASLRRDRTESGVETPLIHIFFQMRDGSYLAFFELPKVEFDFKDQDPSDLHVALEVDEPTMTALYQKAQSIGWAPFGPAELEALTSIYFRDPNGYIVELTTKNKMHDEVMDPDQNKAREILDGWQVDKASI